MPAPSPVPPAPPPVEADLSRTYALVIIVEFIVILALYALGRYFA